MRMRGERKIMKFFFFFFFYINIHTWKYFTEHSSRELNEFEQKDQLRMELSKFRWHEFRCRATILPLSLSFLAWGVGGDPLRFDVPTAIIYDFCRWRKQSTVNWGRYVWSSVLSKWIELAAPANISLSTDRCSLSTIPMIIIYFAYPVYRFKANDYIPETNEKKNSYVQNYPPSNFSYSYRLAICKKKKYPLPVLSIHQSSKRMERLQNINKTNDSRNYKGRRRPPRFERSYIECSSLERQPVFRAFISRATRSIVLFFLPR